MADKKNNVVDVESKINAVDNAEAIGKTPTVDMFEDAKQGFITIVKTNIITAQRIDYMMWVRDKAYKFWGNRLDDMLVMDERLAYLKELQQVCVDTYKKIAEIAKTFEYEEFCEEDMKDYFDGLVPTVDSITTEKQMLEAELIFLCVQPYGSKMNQIHNLVQNELGQRRVNEDIEE